MRLDLVKMHGSSNDILIVKKTREQLFETAEKADEFVRQVCDRNGPLGSDGIYFIDLEANPITAEFYNPDGSFAGMCGNGLRAIARLILEISDVKETLIMSDGNSFHGSLTDSFPGVTSTCISTNSISFKADSLPIKTDQIEFILQEIPESGTDLKFTALSIPNDHVVTISDEFDEAQFMSVGEKLSVPNKLLENGANVSFIVPISDDEFFVRTFERGAGPTASCGSGMTASRAVLSKLGLHTADKKVLIRNVGGPAYVSLSTDTDGNWFGQLDGNATYVYKASVELNDFNSESAIEVSEFTQDLAAYNEVFTQNQKAIEDAGIKCDFSSSDVT